MSTRNFLKGLMLHRVRYKDLAASVRSLTDSRKHSRDFSAEKLIAIQQEKLQVLLELSLTGTDFYPHHYQVHLNKIKRFSPTEDNPRLLLSVLPTLKKESIRSEPALLINKNTTTRQISKTGGTTGQPLAVNKCDATVTWGYALRKALLEDFGIDDSGPQIMLKGFSKPTLKAQIRTRLFQEYFFPAFPSSNSWFEKFEKLLFQKDIEFIESYPTALMAYAKHLEKRPKSIKAVFTTGELLHPHQRSLLESKFGCRVISYYGSNEINGLAFECREGRMHVAEEHVIMETVDESGRQVWDKPGRIIITNLDNHAMPLIRYEIGDSGILTRETCPCGRAHIHLKKIIGRTQDSLINPSGDELPVTFFEGRFRSLTTIGRIQLVQKSASEIEVHYDGLQESAKTEADLLAVEIRKHLGNGVSTTSRHNLNLKQTSRGKTPLIYRVPS